MSTWILTNYRWYMLNANFNWQIMLSSRPPKWQQTDNLKLYLTKSYLYLHLCTDIWQMMTKSISTFVLRIGRWLQICAWQITLWSYLKKSRLYLNLCTGIWQMISRSLFITNMYLQVLFLFQHPYWQLKMISNFPFNRQVVLISDFNWQIMIWFQYPYWSLIFNHYSYMVKICQVQ